MINSLEKEISVLENYDNEDLITELYRREYDFDEIVEDISDQTIRDEFEDREMKDDNLQWELDNAKNDIARLDDLIYKAYIMVIDINFNPEELRKYIEENFKKSLENAGFFE